MDQNLLSPIDSRLTKNWLAGNESIAASYFHTILRRLPFSKPGALRSLGVTAASSGEGASTIAAGLAIAATKELNTNVVIVDANLAAPIQHRWFGVSEADGWTRLMAKGGHVADFVQTSNVPRVSVLSAGTSNERGSGLVSTANFFTLVRELEKDFGLVIVDLPIVDEFSGCLSLVGALEGVLWVVESDRLSAEAAEQVKVRLLQRNARLLGVVMNRNRGVSKWLTQN